MVTEKTTKKTTPKGYVPAKSVKITLASFSKAVKGTRGIKTEIAKRLKVARSTIDFFMKRTPEAQAVYDEELDSVLDFAETKLHNIIDKEDPGTVRWFLATKGRNRGYGEQTDMHITGSQEITIKNADELIASLRKKKS